jgi:hypothetical protein
MDLRLIGPCLGILLAGVCWFPGSTARADEAAEPSLPATVAADLESVASLCREAGGTPRTDKAIARLDLNRDGNQDFVLYVGEVLCDGAASVYGDREKGVTVYAGDGKGGATEAFRDSVFGMKVEGTGDAAKVWLTVSGRQCGKQPAQDFASESFCDRALTWNAASKKFEYEPVASVRMIE